jgi:hypothetical protein
VSSLFDGLERTNASPAKHGEDSFHFLNRAASTYWRTIREELEQWFQTYPSTHRADLRSRFRSRRPDQHWAAWWELYLFRVFTALGFSVEVHPDVATGPGRPDFRVDAEENFYVEATTVFSGVVEEGRHGERESWILNALDEGRSDNFFVGVRFDTVGQERPSTREVVRPVEKWLRGLDPDVVAASMKAGARPPIHPFAFRDWRIRLEAFPIRPEARGDPDHRLVGVGPMSGGYVNDREILGKALERKKRRHSKVDSPLVVAVLGMSTFLDDLDVEQALFGSEAVVIDSGQLVRKPDGFWRGTRGASARDVSAALVGTAIHPPFVTTRWPRLWLNPWATRPLDVEVPFPKATVEAERLSFTDETHPPHEVLALPSDWPGDSNSRFELP